MIDRNITNDNRLKISQVNPKKRPYPMILTFQNEVDANFSSKVQECHLKEDVRKSGQTAIVSANGLLYTGRENEDTTVRNVIIVRNRISGDVKLVEIGNASMKAYIHEEVETTQETDFNQFGEKFGSKRTRRAVEQSKKMKVDMDAVKEKLTASIMKIEVDTELNSQIKVEDSTSEKYLPPMNRNATDPHKVFKLENIFNPEQFDILKINAEKLLDEEECDFEVSDYIKKLISNLSELEKKIKINACCALLYADGVIKYLTDHYKVICNKAYKPCSFSDIISDSILDKFSVNSDKGRTRPQSLKDKAISYIIVLLLIGGNLIIPDIEELRKVLNTSINKLTQMVKVVGARTSISSGKTSILLKLPLIAPPTLRTKRDKKDR